MRCVLTSEAVIGAGTSLAGCAQLCCRAGEFAGYVCRTHTALSKKYEIFEGNNFIIAPNQRVSFLCI